MRFELIANAQVCAAIVAKPLNGAAKSSVPQELHQRRRGLAAQPSRLAASRISQPPPIE